MQTRKCIVKMFDSDGVEHTVEVQAESVYEAALRGFERFDRLSLAKDDMSLTVEIHEEPTVHRLKANIVFGWLKSNAKSPSEQVRKQRLRDELKIYVR